MPVTARLINVPTDVTFDCALVVNVPVTDVKTPAVAPILPTFALAGFVGCNYAQSIYLYWLGL